MIKFGANIQSQTVQRYLGNATQELSRASERLSSGQRINKASDDAAGLAISTTLDKDKLLTQIARRNISDGISMVNILSSGLSSQKEILFRMAELAEQSANGTYSTKQREGLQKEYSSLMDEFDRIADSTEFNGVKLLRNPTPQTISIMAGITGASSGDTSLIQVAAANSHRFAGVQPVQIDVDNDNDSDFTDLFTYDSISKGIFTYNASINAAYVQQAGIVTSARDSLGRAVTFSFAIGSLETVGTVPVSSAPTTPTSLIIFATGTNTAGQSATAMSTISYSNGQVTNPNSVSGTLITFGDGSTSTLSIDLSGTSFYYAKPALTSGPSAIGFTNIQSSYAARIAVDTVANRLNELSAIEGQYGAVVSRLSVAHNVLGAAGENFAAASSRIKDADIAAESSVAIRSGILQQSAASVLAQANQAPQVALSLLRNI